MTLQSSGIAIAVVSLLSVGGASAATLNGVGEFVGNAGKGTSNGVVADSPVGDNYV